VDNWVVESELLCCSTVGWLSPARRRVVINDTRGAAYRNESEERHRPQGPAFSLLWRMTDARVIGTVMAR